MISTGVVVILMIAIFIWPRPFFGFIQPRNDWRNKDLPETKSAVITIISCIIGFCCAKYDHPAIFWSFIAVVTVSLFLEHCTNFFSFIETLWLKLKGDYRPTR